MDQKLIDAVNALDLYALTLILAHLPVGSELRIEKLDGDRIRVSRIATPGDYWLCNPQQAAAAISASIHEALDKARPSTRGLGK